MSDGLLPCPFCGGEAKRGDNGPTKEQLANGLSWGRDFDDGGSFIECQSCHASTALHFDRRENLVSDWNRRVYLRRDSLARRLAALDGIRLQDIRSTAGPAEDANNWREYLGRADDLLAFISADMEALPLTTTEPGHG